MAKQVQEVSLFCWSGPWPLFSPKARSAVLRSTFYVLPLRSRSRRSRLLSAPGSGGRRVGVGASLLLSSCAINEGKTAEFERLESVGGQQGPTNYKPQGKTRQFSVPPVGY